MISITPFICLERNTPPINFPSKVELDTLPISIFRRSRLSLPS